MSQAKYAYRLPPCPDYDMEGMESWLEDMAAKGLILSPDGFFMGIAAFEKTAPRQLKYRLEPMPKQPSFWDGSQGPDARALELHRDFGWEYVTFRGQFYIYVTDDPNAPELNTDPQIQALALKVVVKRSRGSLISSLLSLIITICLCLFGKLAGMLVLIGPWIAVFFLFTILWFDCQKVSSWLHLRKIRKRLRSGEALTHRADYRSKAVHYRLCRISDVLVGIALLVCISLAATGSPIGSEGEIPLEEYTGGFPFATLQDIFPEARIEYHDNWESTVTHWENSVSDNYEYHEYADLIFPDGTEVSAVFYVRYHRTPFPALAKAMVWEAHLYSRQLDGYAPLDIRPEGVDYVLAYEDISPKIAFCKDGTMVETRLRLYAHDDSPVLTQEQFAQIMADSVKGGAS